MRILVTGAHGWTAKAIIEALSALGHKIIGIDLAESVSHVEPALFSQIYYGSVSDYEFVLDASRGCDLIIHLAVAIHDGYETPKIPFNVNVRGTANIFESAVRNNIARVILMSSAPFHVDFVGKLNAVEDCLQGQGGDFMYDLTKCLQEDIAKYYARTHELQAITLRAGHIVDGRTNLDPKGRGLESINYGREAWICRYDLARAVVQAIDYPLDDYDAFHIIGTEIAKKRFDIERTEQLLGFVPEIRFEVYQ